MKAKRSHQIIAALIIFIVLVGIAYVGYSQFINRREKDALQIVSIDLLKSEGDTNFMVTVLIKNTGSNNISDAELNIILIKDNDIIDSDKQSFDLLTDLEGTYSTTFSDVLIDPNSTYKAIATIYLKNRLLDTKTITKQY